MSHTTSGLTCLALAAALAACASGGGYVDDGSPDADRRFYEGRCGVCHVPFHPTDFAARKWPAILVEMAPKAGLTAPQRERVLRYLTAPESATTQR